MDENQGLPEAVRKVARSLAPYIKQRQEAAQIRRVLASHLTSHVNQNGDISLSRPLSLVDDTCNVDATPHGVKGLQKEYLRCVRANIKAQKEYAEISREHRTGRDDDDTRGLIEITGDEVVSPMECFTDLVRQRQKHDRLRIIRDYLDVLAQKPASTVDHLDPEVVLQDVGSLPKMPSEVLNGSGTTQKSSTTDLTELVDQLEKSVLRAKMLLKREQSLLAKVKAENTSAPGGRGSRLEAVGMTRSALINWIEAELSRAGESGPEPETRDSVSPDKRGKQYIDSELSSIHRQYARYTKARQTLINAATAGFDPPATTQVLEDRSLIKEGTYISNGMETTHCYLEGMVNVSNEQKAMILQKSHVTISLSKQLKEANQGLDRLADESHLLPAHPMPLLRTPRNGLEGHISFGDEISNHEKPDSSLRAQGWVHAAQSAGQSTRSAVSARLKEGTVALAEAQDSLLELQRLLGVDIDIIGERGNSVGNKKDSAKSRNIWAVLDGNMGVIKGDMLD